jgi:hypothetical protein
MVDRYNNYLKKIVWQNLPTLIIPSVKCIRIFPKRHMQELPTAALFYSNRTAPSCKQRRCLSRVVWSFCTHLEAMGMRELWPPATGQFLQSQCCVNEATCKRVHMDDCIYRKLKTRQNDFFFLIWSCAC